MPIKLVSKMTHKMVGESPFTTRVDRAPIGVSVYKNGAAVERRVLAKGVRPILPKRRRPRSN